MKDKNAHLETSLSAETRLKLDLFSALGDAKRQMEIQQGQLSHISQCRTDRSLCCLHGEHFSSKPGMSGNLTAVKFPDIPGLPEVMSGTIMSGKQFIANFTFV